jgi:uncharacterized RDD family membrane protein YckC
MIRQPISDAALGSPGRRFGSYLVDRVAMYGLQLWGMFLGAFVAAVMVGTQTPRSILETHMSKGMTVGWIFWGVAAWFLNYGVLQGMAGATLGKLLFGLRVVNGQGHRLGIYRSLTRTFAYAISALPLAIGFLAIFWNKERRCWHDSLCKTLVIRKEAEATLLAPPEQTDVTEVSAYEHQRAA